MLIKPTLVPILASAGLLLGANGYLLTLIPLRAQHEGFSETLVGMMGSAYFIGYILASIGTPRLIQRSGHIRVFGSFAVIAAIACLALVLIPDQWVWLVGRLATGMAFAGCSMVLESWLNGLAGRGDRARLLSVYRLVDLGMVTGLQFLVPWLGPDTFAVFAVGAMLFCVALLPVSLSTLSSPAPPESTALRLGMVYRLSPVACIGVITIGLTNGAFRTVGPVFAEAIGLTVDQIALFMSLGIAGGAVAQYPLGWLSDRIGRRTVLIGATAGAAIASILLANTTGALVFAAIGLFGGFSLPLYSLSVAHANDFAKPGQFLEIAAGLSLFYALGATVGPLVVAMLIEHLGAQSFFIYNATLHTAFIAFVLYRMQRRAAVPRAMRRRFVGLLRTSTELYRRDADDSPLQPANPPIGLDHGPCQVAAPANLVSIRRTSRS